MSYLWCCHDMMMKANNIILLYTYAECKVHKISQEDTSQTI